MTKKLKNLINEVGLSYKNEISKLIAINLLFLLAIAIIILFFYNLLLVIGIVFLAVVFDYWYFYRYTQMKEKIREKQIDEFIEIFSYFRIYVSNNENVYTALKNILQFASYNTKERLQTLINEIDEDKSLAPFVKFSDYYKNKTIEEVMVSLYEMICEGNELIYLNQFIRVFEEFKTQRNNDSKTKRYKVFDYLTLFSLVGSGILMIILVFGIINLLGDMNFNGF